MNSPTSGTFEEIISSKGAPVSMEMVLPESSSKVLYSGAEPAARTFDMIKDVHRMISRTADSLRFLVIVFSPWCLDQ